MEWLRIFYHQVQSFVNSNEFIYYLFFDLRRVTEISGTLSPSLFSWTSLQVFRTPGNYLSGTLPVCSSLQGQISCLLWPALTDFNVDYNHISGSVPTEYAVLRNLESFSAESNQLDGSLPNLSSWSLHLSRIFLAGNQFVGAFSTMLLPPNATRVDFSLNQLNGEVQLKCLPISMVLLNLSANRYNGLLLTASELSMPFGQSGVMVLDITENDLFCPLPGVSQLYQANLHSKHLTLLTSDCRTNFSELMTRGIVFGALMLFTFVILVSVKFFCKRAFSILQASLKQPRLLLCIFSLKLLWQLYSFFNVALAFRTMFSAIDVITPNNCVIFNLKELWIDEMGHFSNSTGSEFPTPNSYTNFTEYITLLYNGFPGRLLRPSVQNNENTFAQLCRSFIPGECDYWPDLYICERVADPAQSSRAYFVRFLLASVVLFTTKEILKQLFVLRTLFFVRRPDYVTANALCSPLLLCFLGCARFQNLVVAFTPSMRDNLLALIYDGPLLFNFLLF